MTTKLNDLQLILLSTAANRKARNLLPAPQSVEFDDNRVKTAIASLIRRKLAIWTGGEAIITDAGQTAIGVFEANAPERPKPSAAVQADPTETVSEEVLMMSSISSVRSGTKIALVIELLSRESGASLNDLTTATGWLPHTVRAALTGLRKKGHVVIRSRKDSRTRYCLAV